MFTSEAEARNFCDQLRTRHGAQDIQLLDEDGVAMEAVSEQATGIEKFFG
jgi:hypothetical protein